MSNQWFLLKEKFAHLTTREQYIILFTGVFAMFMLFNSFSFEVSSERQVKMKQSIRQAKVTNQQLQVAIAKAEVTMANDPNVAIDAQIKKFEDQLSKVDNRLLSLTNELISPQKMRSALRDLLSQSPGVEIQTFIALQPQPLLSSKQKVQAPSEGQETEQAINLYRHGIRLSLKGDYFALRNYLKSIEQLPWAFYWQSFDYQVNGYPEAKLNIEMYSLSTKKEFIGV